MRTSARQKRKAARLKWSRNANAAKARKRLAHVPDRWPEMGPYFPWKITLTNKLDGAKFRLDLKSARHAKRFCDAVLAHYLPDTRSGGQERL
jgi:hypothetical protein